MKPISWRLIVHMDSIHLFIRKKLMRCILSGLQCDALTITEIRLIIIIFFVLFEELCVFMEIAKFVLEHSENEMTVIVARRKRKIKIEMFLFKERERR